VQGSAFEEMVETLWPYSGFTVKASERKLGQGRLTLTDQSLLFEAKNGEIIGFDLPALRLIRLQDPSSVEAVYSFHGELRSASFRVVCTFADGAERDELPSKDDPDRMSLLRALTGGVVARFLSDHSSARTEGLSKVTEEKFEEQVNDLRNNIALFPSKKEFEDNVWWDEELRKRSLELGEKEPVIWDDPYRDKILYTGTNPRMTIDNALEKLDILQDDWINGRLDPKQRACSAAVSYLITRRQNELGYLGVNGEPTNVWNDAAERIRRNEGRVGVELLKFI